MTGKTHALCGMPVGALTTQYFQRYFFVGYGYHSSNSS